MTGTNGHAPVLEGWVTAEQAAKVLGVSRQTAARIFQRRDLRTIHAVGGRPLYVARVEEVKRLRDLFELHGDWATAIEQLQMQSPSRLGGKKWVRESV